MDSAKLTTVYEDIIKIYETIKIDPFTVLKLQKDDEELKE